MEGAGWGGRTSRQTTPQCGLALAFSQKSADSREEDGVIPCEAQDSRHHSPGAASPER